MQQNVADMPLANAKHERLAQAFAAGMSIADANASAGYSRSLQSSWRVRARADFQARVVAIKARSAEINEVTMTELIGNFREQRDAAFKDKQYSAATGATEKLAKLCGFMTERIDLRQTVDVRSIVLRLDAGEPLEAILAEARPSIEAPRPRIAA